MGKGAIPPVVKAQYELYERKLARALKVSENLKKRDASFQGFSEKIKPETGKPFDDMSMSAKVKRVNTWLKNFDRSYWDTQFSQKPVPRPAKEKKISPSRAPWFDAAGASSSGDAVFARKDVQKSVKSVSYWVCYPERSTKRILEHDADIVEIQFSETTPQNSADKVVSLLLEIHVVGGCFPDKGRVAVLEKGAEVTIDYLLGSPFETINLVSGVNKVTLRSMTDTADSISSLLNERKVCILRSDTDSSFYIRKWANFLQEVPSVLPISSGKISTIVLP
uniref:Capsid protein n=1 Tax=Citrus idaeovirus TaxID=334448 RepID=Q3SAK9_9VIRU|nr:capsid protein [Citrus idaeovirus]